MVQSGNLENRISRRPAAQNLETRQSGNPEPSVFRNPIRKKTRNPEIQKFPYCIRKSILEIINQSGNPEIEKTGHLDIQPSRIRQSRDPELSYSNVQSRKNLAIWKSGKPESKRAAVQNPEIRQNPENQTSGRRRFQNLEFLRSASPDVYKFPHLKINQKYANLDVIRKTGHPDVQVKPQ